MKQARDMKRRCVRCVQVRGVRLDRTMGYGPVLVEVDHYQEYGGTRGSIDLGSYETELGYALSIPEREWLVSVLDDWRTVDPTADNGANPGVEADRNA